MEALIYPAIVLNFSSLFDHLSYHYLPFVESQTRVSLIFSPFPLSLASSSTQKLPLLRPHWQLYAPKMSSPQT